MVNATPETLHLFMLIWIAQSNVSLNFHWNVPRSVNSLFTERAEILNRIENSIRKSLQNDSEYVQKHL
jgi:hypothetical protein